MSYSCSTLDLENLAPELKEQYSLLLPPKFRCCLEGKDPAEISFTKIIAVGLMQGREPVGIALAGIYEGTGMAELYCLKVEERHRKPTIGLELLNRIEDECFKTDAIILNHDFRKTEADSPFIGEALQANAWSKPKLKAVRFFYDGYTFKPPWFNHAPELPKDFKIFYWKNLKESERRALELDQYEGRFSGFESPFQQEDKIEKMNSLGLRYKGKVVGWYITHRLAPDTIQHTIIYIDPEFRSTGYPIRLGIESAKIQQKSPVRWGIFELNIEFSTPVWIKFISRRFAPYSLFIDEIFHTWKAKGPEIFKR